VADPKTQTVIFDGKPNVFPADFTEAEISAALGAIPAANAKDVPQAKTWTWKDAAIDVPVGMAKQLGRYAQVVPGVAAATDALYGLPSGASKASMQPTNTTQKVGGYMADAALMAATAGAEAGAPILSRTAGYVSNPTVLRQAATAIEPATALAGDVAKALKASLSVGPPTAEKIAGLIIKYGKDAVKIGLTGTLGAGAYHAFKYLF
jgi:hypothetical protein